MDLILWRHAEAESLSEHGDDPERPLTPRGEKQAARMAVWLDRQLPDGLRVLASPARRTEQTVRALGRKYKLRAELLPGGSPDDLLELVQWPRTRGAVLVVGHQPMLGQVVARLDDDELRLEVAREERQAEALAAQLRELETGFRREEIAQADAAVKRAQADADRLEADFARQEALKVGLQPEIGRAHV